MYFVLTLLLLLLLGVSYGIANEQEDIVIGVGKIGATSALGSWFGVDQCCSTLRLDSRDKNDLHRCFNLIPNLSHSKLASGC